MWRLRLDTMRWEEGPPLLRERWHFACVAVEGGEEHGSLVCAGGHGAQRDVESLAPAGAGWVQRPPLSSGYRRYFGSVACGDGELLPLGGMRDHEVVASVERLDLATGTCTPRQPPLLEPWSFFAYAALRGGRVVIAGGRGPGGRLLATAELYDPATGARTQLPPMSTSRSSAQGVVLSDGRFAVLGGRSNVNTTLASCQALDLRTLQWAPLPDMIQPHSGFAAFAVGSSVVVAGGGGEGPFYHPLDSVEVLELSSQSWRAVPEARIPDAVFRPGCALVPHAPPA